MGRKIQLLLGAALFCVITFLTWDAIIFDARASIKVIAFVYWIIGILGVVLFLAE